MAFGLFGALAAAIDSTGPPMIQTPTAWAFDFQISIGPCQQLLTLATSHVLHIGITYDDSACTGSRVIGQCRARSRRRRVAAVLQHHCHSPCSFFLYVIPPSACSASVSLPTTTTPAQNAWHSASVGGTRSGQRSAYALATVACSISGCAISTSA